MKSEMLFVSAEGLGDSILNLPILKALASNYQVQVLCSENNGTAALLRALGFEAVGFDNKWQMIKKARASRAETLFVPFPTWKKELAVALSSKARERFLFRPIEYRWAKVFWSYTADADPKIHTVENSVALLKKLPHYQALDPAEIFDLKPLLRLAVRADDSGPILAIHPTGSTPAKFYPQEFWQNLWAILMNHFKEIHIFCGRGSTELPYCKSLVTKLGPRARLFSGLSFPELLGRLDAAKYFIGSESALLHISALLDKPVLGLWCHGDIRVYHPYGNQVRVFLPQEIRSKAQHEYPDEAPPYLKRASADQVAAIVQGQATPEFQITPLYKNPVHFHVF